MPTVNHGGIWALAGYLYQVVGTLGISARIANLAASEDPGDLGDIDVVLELDLKKTVEAYPERFSNDAVFSVTDDCVIVQFKYSQNSDDKITRPELKKIIEGLDKSASEATAAGYKVTACVLVTNRQFTSHGSAAKALWESALAAKRSYALRCSHNFSVEWATDQLRAFAAEYGATENETRGGIRQIVGGVFLKTGWHAFQAGVFEEELVEAFTGFKDARRITATAVKPISEQRLIWFGGLLRVEQWSTGLITRDAHASLAQLVTERSLVFVSGKGGCGKSILLWQVVQAGYACREVQLARNISDAWIMETVRSWRGLPPGTGQADTIAQAVARLVKANPTGPRPILWLSLDGIDEETNPIRQTVCIKVLLQEFWQRDQARSADAPPSATLVVTCRDLDGWRRWLDLPYDYPGERPATVVVDDFSDRELAQIAARFPELHPLMADPIRQHSYSDRGSLHTFPLGTSLTDSTRLIGDEEVMDALGHPAMWRALLNINDSATRRLAIQGESNAKHLLVEHYIRWFCDKLRNRNAHVQIPEPAVFGILTLIAEQTQGKAQLAYDQDWMGPSRQAFDIRDADGRTLFEEADSAGLIVIDNRLFWHWRHPLIPNCLAMNTKEG